MAFVPDAFCCPQASQLIYQPLMVKDFSTRNAEESKGIRFAAVNFYHRKPQIDAEEPPGWQKKTPWRESAEPCRETYQ